MTRLDVPLPEEDELDRDDVDLLEPDRDIVDRVPDDLDLLEPDRDTIDRLPDDLDLLEPDRDTIDRLPLERTVRLVPFMILPLDRIRLLGWLSCLFVMTVLPVYPPLLDPDEYQPQK